MRIGKSTKSLYINNLATSLQKRHYLHCFICKNFVTQTFERLEAIDPFMRKFYCTPYHM